MGGGWFAENACISMRTHCPTASRSCPRWKGGLPDVGGLLEAGGPGGAPAGAHGWRPSACLRGPGCSYGRRVVPLLAGLWHRAVTTTILRI